MEKELQPMSDKHQSDADPMKSQPTQEQETKKEPQPTFQTERSVQDHLGQPGGHPATPQLPAQSLNTPPATGPFPGDVKPAGSTDQANTRPTEEVKINVNRQGRVHVVVKKDGKVIKNIRRAPGKKHTPAAFRMVMEPSHNHAPKIDLTCDFSGSDGQTAAQDKVRPISSSEDCPEGPVRKSARLNLAGRHTVSGPAARQAPVTTPSANACMPGLDLGLHCANYLQLVFRGMPSEQSGSLAKVLASQARLARARARAAKAQAEAMHCQAATEKTTAQYLSMCEAYHRQGIATGNETPMDCKEEHDEGASPKSTDKATAVQNKEDNPPDGKSL